MSLKPLTNRGSPQNVKLLAGLTGQPVKSGASRSVPVSCCTLRAPAARQPPSRTGGSPDRQFCQQILDRDQPCHVRPHRLAQVSDSAEYALVAFGTSRGQHGGEVVVERSVFQGDLDHAPDPRRVQGYLLLPGVVAARWGWSVDVLIPEAPQPEDLLGGSPQAPALSCAITASATWLVPTAVGSSRFSFRS